MLQQPDTERPIRAPEALGCSASRLWAHALEHEIEPFGGDEHLAVVVTWSRNIRARQLRAARGRRSTVQERSQADAMVAAARARRPRSGALGAHEARAKVTGYRKPRIPTFGSPRDPRRRPASPRASIFWPTLSFSSRASSMACDPCRSPLFGAHVECLLQRAGKLGAAWSCSGERYRADPLARGVRCNDSEPNGTADASCPFRGSRPDLIMCVDMCGGLSNSRSLMSAGIPRVT